MMREGETWEFVMPPALGYGDRGYVAQTAQERSIPPGTTLYFLIELLSVEHCPQ
jgi:FKBP-type peptidyl-prolyl cis-trans isomerase